MLHKISAFCDKINAIHEDSKKLRDLKYNHPKTRERDLIIQALIDQIQADCYLVSRDKSDYIKND